jgi:hypothetical protein
MLPHPCLLKGKEFLHDDYTALHTDNLLQTHQLSAAVAEAGQLDYDVNGGADLLSHCVVRDA